MAFHYIFVYYRILVNIVIIIYISMFHYCNLLLSIKEDFVTLIAM